MAVGLRAVRWTHALAGAMLLAASSVVASAQSVSLQTGQRSGIRGVVFDSVAMRPLAGASVQAIDITKPTAAHAATSDSLGRFELPDLAAGVWVVAAMHPRLDSLGLDQIRSSVTVVGGMISSTVVAVPNAQRLARLVCGEPTVPGDTSGFLVGTIRSAAADRAPVAGSVRIEWLELSVTPQGFIRTRETRTAASGADGRYLACDLPAGGLVYVSASHGADSSGFVALQIPLDGIQQRDLYVGQSRVQTLPRTAAPLDDEPDADTTAQTVRRGDGRLRGRLRNSSGAPLKDARVVIRDAGLEVRTDSTGRFAFANLPTGTWNLDVRAIGHEPLTRPIDVLADDSTTIAFDLSRIVPVDTFRIRSRLPNNPWVNLTGFEQRRKAGFGRYMGPEELNRMDPLWFNDIIRGFPSLRLERANWGYVVTMRATGMAARCAPRVYVDNVITPNDGSLDNFLMAKEINAVEVYSGSMGPPQYMDFMSGCGSIVVWTGPRIDVNKKR